MTQLYANNAISTLAATLSAVATTLTISPGHGTRFPTVVAPDFCYCTLEDASNNIEIVKVTAHGAGATSMTIVRAQQGTTAHSYIIGDLCELRLTASELTGFETDIDWLYAHKANKDGDTYTGVHDFSGASAVVLPANTTIGTVSPAEILCLDGITGNIQGQLNLKGNIAGQAWTGTHDFTGATAVGLPAATFIGDVSATEISYLDGVTGSIQGQLNLRSLRAGDTYAGTHDFSGATIRMATRPVGTNDNTGASMAALQQAVFASFANLPADPGDPIVRVLTTVSGFKSWEPPPMSDIANYLAGIT